MVRVKVIRNESTLIERDINEWLDSLRFNKTFNFSIIDMKIDHIKEKDIYTVFIIYQQMAKERV